LYKQQHFSRKASTRLLHARLLIIPATLSLPSTSPLNLMLNTKKAPESRAPTGVQTALAHGGFKHAWLTDTYCYVLVFER
jgi:hypothetical protein